VAGAGLDEEGLVEAGWLELEAGAVLTGRVAAEALGAAAESDELPDEPPPQDAQSRAAKMITTARMRSLFPIPVRWL
jgi:hypothetical protein